MNFYPAEAKTNYLRDKEERQQDYHVRLEHLSMLFIKLLLYVFILEFKV